MVEIAVRDWGNILTVEDTNFECVWFFAAIFPSYLCTSLFEIIQGLKDDTVGPKSFSNAVAVSAMGYHFMGRRQVNAIDVCVTAGKRQ